MALYDLRNPLQKEQFLARTAMLAKKGAVVALYERQKQRSLQSNKYLHVILAYFGTQYGETMEYVKKNYYKFLCNREIFLRERDDAYLGHITYLRSSAELTQEEMNVSIERFRNWAVMEAGVYIPEPHEQDLLAECEIEIQRNKEYI